MDVRLREVLDGRQGNYMMPFFWLHGEEESLLVREVEKIYGAGIRSMCLESRTHEDFVKDGWWRDVDIILREAKKRDMTVWVLDDKHFPTGYAAGLVAQKYPERRKWHLIQRHVDVMGPACGALLTQAQGDPSAERSLIGVVACRRTGVGEEMDGEPVVLTGCVRDGLLYWDVPPGCWRVFFLYRSREGASLPDYIHMIDEQSVDVLIEAVYEPHYRRYKEEFGKTFAGFFSDEPCFGNTVVDSYGVQPYWYNQSVGTPYLAMPWRDDMPARLSRELGEDVLPLLPALWYPMGEKTARVRLAYMNTVTKLYRDCFSRRLGDWCRERGVQYIGHVIEDMNCSSCMGGGAGHYFRALDGQDMAGIDVVLHQILPGLSGCTHTAECYGGAVDPDFFHYVPAKLASSLAHIHPRMKGRALCEIYGAYGWGEGVPMMKWLTDHMLVRGINHFVPHAFTPTYPDPDCPPHFYAAGHHPQYRDFGLLMAYANRMAHLLADTRPVVSAALLYHAQAEWSGGAFQYVQEPAKALYDAQLDYHILPEDALEQAVVESEAIRVADMRYPCLVVPYAAVLPAAVLKELTRLAAAGADIVFAQGTPQRTAEGEIFEAQGMDACETAGLPARLAGRGYADVTLSPPFPLLRIGHYVRGDVHFMMLFNEAMEAFDGVIHLPCRGDLAALDLLTGEYRGAAVPDGALAIRLEPGQSRLLTWGGELPDVQPEKETGTAIPLEVFDISIAQAGAYPSFKTYRTAAPLHDMTGPDALPGFSGYIRYETTVTLPETEGCRLRLGRVGETAHVWVNGSYAGARICPPYDMELSRWIHPGENRLCMEVANSPAYAVRDGFSRNLLLPPSGLLGPVYMEITGSCRYECVQKKL